MSIQEMLLNRLRTQNPQGYERLMSIKNSGKNPTDAIAEMYAKGEISDSDLKKVQRQARMLGVSISDEDIREAETIEPKAEPQLGSLFKGLF